MDTITTRRAQISEKELAKIVPKKFLNKRRKPLIEKKSIKAIEKELKISLNDIPKSKPLPFLYKLALENIDNNKSLRSIQMIYNELANSDKTNIKSKKAKSLIKKIVLTKAKRQR